jgi:serine/threonine-protein kinase SRPK3
MDSDSRPAAAKKKRRNNNKRKKKKKTAAQQQQQQQQEQKQARTPSSSRSRSRSSDGRSEDGNDSDEEEEDEGREGYKTGGYHPVQVGEVYGGRFKVISKLGWGHFSTVWLTLDQETSSFSALKIQKSAEHYREAAADEIKLLECAKKGMQPGTNTHVVKLIAHFEHKGPHGTRKWRFSG